MFRLSLIELLNALAVDMERSFVNINSGGCCVAAGMIGARLQQHVPVRIAVSDCWGARKSIEEVRESTNNSTDPNKWEDHGIDFSHVVIEFDYDGATYHYDTKNGCVPAKGTDPIFGYQIVEGRLSVGEAIALGDGPGWNKRFDRNQIPAMEHVVDEYFTSPLMEKLAA